MKVFRIRPAPTNRMGNNPGLLFKVEMAILHMIGVNHVSDRLNLPPIAQGNLKVGLEICRRHQFPLAQILKRLGLMPVRHGKRHPLAMRVLRGIKRENKAGIFDRATMMDGPHTETPVPPPKRPHRLFLYLETGIPQK